jgi:hypothetical protein
MTKFYVHTEFCQVPVRRKILVHLVRTGDVGTFDYRYLDPVIE